MGQDYTMPSNPLPHSLGIGNVEFLLEKSEVSSCEVGGIMGVAPTICRVHRIPSSSTVISPGLICTSELVDLEHQAYHLCTFSP